MLFLLVIFCSYSDESDVEPESFLMNKMGLAESALYEVINDHQTEIKVGRVYLFLLINRYILLNVSFRVVYF